VRPDRLATVLGTTTGVGKTWVAAALARMARAVGSGVCARKPVQSFAPAAPADGPTDAEVLAAATGERPEDVCPAHRSYPLAMAPPMAVEVLGLEPFTVADLVAETAWPAGVALGLVETVGGPRSPVAVDGDSVHLTAALAPDLVVLVADSGLGALNAVRLAAVPLAALSAPTVVFLNRYRPEDDLHRRNRAWLASDGLRVVTDLAALNASVQEVPARRRGARPR
jgi:dethiobiotin synthetase